MTETTKTGDAPGVTLNELLDRSPWTLSQKWLLVLAAAALTLDGFDNAVLALSIPTIAKDWGVERGAFSLVLALGLAGLCVGTIIAGWLGDRFGRKVVLVVSVGMFGVCTLAAGWADNMTQLTVLRILAGLGMGGAVPNATILIAEITPTARRSLAVGIATVAISGGGLVGGLVAAFVLPEWGWRTLFVVAGLSTLPVFLLLWWVAPESPRFLQQRGAAADAIDRALRRLGLGAPAGGLAPEPSLAEGVARGRVRDVFAPDMLRDTLALWWVFLCGMTGGYLLTSWIPSTLAAAGMGPALTSQGLQAYTLGSVVGVVIASLLMGRFSSRVLIAFAGVGVATSAALAAGVNGLSVPPLFALIALEGACMASITSTLFAVAAHIYPQQIRATGTGIALTFGRSGAIGSSFVGGMTVDAAGGGTTLFAIAGALLLGAATGLAVLRRHVPATPRA